MNEPIFIFEKPRTLALRYWVYGTLLAVAISVVYMPFWRFVIEVCDTINRGWGHG